MSRSNESESWDEYWQAGASNRIGERIYSRVASFYRNKFIGPHLKRNLIEHFPNKAFLLHAGCGAGEVDKFVPNQFEVLGIDMSKNAIDSYIEMNPRFQAKVMNLFDLPGDLPKFDGIYNLGVMEHFSKSEVSVIFKRFNLCLNPGGKLIIFWPPTFGLSVIFLSIIHFFLRILQGDRFKPLHPDEPNKIQGIKSARKILKESGFELIKYSFSFRDAFTYSVIVATKHI